MIKALLPTTADLPTPSPVDGRAQRALFLVLHDTRTADLDWRHSSFLLGQSWGVIAGSGKDVPGMELGFGASAF